MLLLYIVMTTDLAMANHGESLRCSSGSFKEADSLSDPLRGRQRIFLYVFREVSCLAIHDKAAGKLEKARHQGRRDYTIEKIAQTRPEPLHISEKT
jgi:hypothetical protein